MKRLHVLYIPHPIDGVNETWGDVTIATISAGHDVRIFERGQPAAPQFEGAEAVVDLGGNMSGELVEFAGHAGVRYVQAQTNGLDHVEVEAILASGMTLAHCPGNLSAVALAESAMMFILNLAHVYGEGQRNFDAGVCYFPIGRELVGLKLAIIGFGASGQELARRARPFGLKILAIDVRPIEQDVLDELQPEFLGSPDALDRVIGDCNFLSVHLHLTDATHHVIDARRIGLMKRTACVINVARGALIDEQALYEALSAGRIGGAGLDAFAEEPPDPTRPVYQLPNVYVSPHIAGSTDGTARKRAQFAADNLDRFARGEPLVAQVTGRENL